MSELDNLLDATLDDLKDLPSFTPYAAGAHKVLASFAMDKVNGKDVIKLNFVYLELVELEDPEAEVPKEGDTSNVMFMLDNEFGLGNFKKCAAPFAEALGLTSLRDIVEGVKDVEVLIVSNQRVNKKDPSQVYMNVKEIQVI
jgi:hypothetical protein